MSHIRLLVVATAALAACGPKPALVGEYNGTIPLRGGCATQVNIDKVVTLLTVREGYDVQHWDGVLSLFGASPGHGIDVKLPLTGTYRPSTVVEERQRIADVVKQTVSVKDGPASVELLSGFFEALESIQVTPYNMELPINAYFDVTVTGPDVICGGMHAEGTLTQFK